eukprot:5661277-Amphidinium_carterae.1
MEYAGKEYKDNQYEAHAKEEGGWDVSSWFGGPKQERWQPSSHPKSVDSQTFPYPDTCRNIVSSQFGTYFCTPCFGPVRLWFPRG